jgi:hypothetical protein
MRSSLMATRNLELTALSVAAHPRTVFTNLLPDGLRAVAPGSTHRATVIGVRALSSATKEDLVLSLLGVSLIILGAVIG